MKLRLTENASEGEAVVCAPLTDPLLMKGNIVGVCSRCQAAVQHRPNVPATLARVCMNCFAKDYDETDEVLVTRATIIEAYGERNKN